MTDLEAIERRHSVRAYLDRKIDLEAVRSLQKMVETLNREYRLHIQLVTNEPKAFQSRLAKYGKFKNVSNYLVMAARPGEDTEETIGYCGEKLVLEAQKLGLNTCWVGLTYRKIPSAYHLEKDEKIYCVIALGYGEDQGRPHKSKKLEDIADLAGAPEWFRKGAEAALLAPTAVNQQAFHFRMENGKVLAETKRRPYGKVDLGIAKAHFEIGSGRDSSVFAS